MSKKAAVKMSVKNTVRSLVPLPLRKQVSVWLNRQAWLDRGRRAWWSQELVSDLAAKNINEYHKFLWSNHLSYAATYETASRFGLENMKQSRKMFFDDLRRHLAAFSVNARKIRSAFEVGCSLGYQLRFMETDAFPSASELEGIDIDAHAIRSGAEYLRSVGSKVRLHCGDMEDLENVLGEKHVDVIICCGVLMYLEEAAAARLVATLLGHTNCILGFTGLAHPAVDNSLLASSTTRDRDRTFIHNIDSMIARAGGEIVARRWDGANLIDGHTIYFVFGRRRKTGVDNHIR